MAAILFRLQCDNYFKSWCSNYNFHFGVIVWQDITMHTLCNAYFLNYLVSDFDTILRKIQINASSKTSIPGITSKNGIIGKQGHLGANWYIFHQVSLCFIYSVKIYDLFCKSSLIDIS